MSKFKLRNLNNEKRRLEKQIKKVEKQIEKVENTKVIAEGVINIGSKVKFNTINGIPSDKEIVEDFQLNVKYEKYKHEVMCTLVMNNDLLGKEVFIGKARCANDDEFDVATGMCIAECRAIQKVYEHIIKKIG